MKIMVCIGSACHIKGSRQIVEQLQYQIDRDHLGDKIELGGAFCMGQCRKGVCITVDDELFSVGPETVTDFFENTVKSRL